MKKSIIEIFFLLFVLNVIGNLTHNIYADSQKTDLVPMYSQAPINNRDAWLSVSLLKWAYQEGPDTNGNWKLTSTASASLTGDDPTRNASYLAKGWVKATSPSSNSKNLLTQNASDSNSSTIHKTD